MHVPLPCASFLAEVLWWLTACADSSKLFHVNKSCETADGGGSLKSQRLGLIQWMSLCKAKLWSTQVHGREGVYWISAFEFILCCGRLFSRLVVVFQICFSEVPKAVSFVYTYGLCVVIWASKTEWQPIVSCHGKAYKATQKTPLCLWKNVGQHSSVIWCHVFVQMVCS